MVVAQQHVDLAALKQRHPLADMVLAAGVHLRGQGRVRQGLCPFHEETEASFTVYGDTARFHCFGCGASGDVLDFVQRTEGLTLPQAIRRLDSGVGPAANTTVRSATPGTPRGFPGNPAAAAGPGPADGRGAVLPPGAVAVSPGTSVPRHPRPQPRDGPAPGARLCSGARAAGHLVGRGL